MFFEVGSYKVHIYSRSVLYSNHDQRSLSLEQQISISVQVYVVKGKFTPLYIAVRLPFILALHFLNCRTSVSLRSCELRRDTEVLRFYT